MSLINNHLPPLFLANHSNGERFFSRSTSYSQRRYSETATIEAMEERDSATGECLRTFHNIPGLNVQGWDFRGAVHDFTEEDIELLRMYGAIFNEEDEARWRQIMAEEEAYYGQEA